MKDSMNKNDIMKNLILICFLYFSGISQAQIYPVTPTLENENSFSMILLPDPQSYIKFEANQPLFELMTRWCALNRKKLAIKAVLCTGDLVEQNEWPVPDNRNGDQTSTQQWEAAARSFSCLDNRLPYIICTGNHDYGYEKAENRLCHFPEYFPVEKNACWKDCLVSTAKNAFELPTLENAAYEFDTDTWGKILVISLEFAPREEALHWAKKLADSPRYKAHKIIVLTHSYLEIDGSIFEKENYKMTPANYGKAIWEKLIYPTPNIDLLICGHACEITDLEGTVSYREDRNSKGEYVPQMMFNAQTADKQWFGNGGDGWLRILEFMPDGKTIKVKTFSPLFAVSPTTAEFAWRTAAYDQFDIVINKK